MCHVHIDFLHAHHGNENIALDQPDVGRSIAITQSISIERWAQLRLGPLAPGSGSVCVAGERVTVAVTHARGLIPSRCDPHEIANCSHGALSDTQTSEIGQKPIRVTVLATSQNRLWRTCPEHKNPMKLISRAAGLENFGR
jgi:hypothetical protein